MQLNAVQRKMIRRIVQVSTDLTAHRFSSYQSWKDLRSRLADLKRRRANAERQAEGAARVNPSFAGMTNKHLEDLDARIENEFVVIGELQSDLEAESELREKEWTEIGPMVDGAQRLADRVLNHAGIDRENLEPVVALMGQVFVGGEAV